MIAPIWRTLNLTTAILPVEAQRLRELAKGKEVLEIGAANGYSAIVMALAGALHITSVDPHEDTWLGDTLTSMRDGSAILTENEDDVILGLQLLKPGGTLARHDYGHPTYPGFKELLDKHFPEGGKLTNSLFEVTI